MTSKALRLTSFGVAFAGRTVLADITLEIGATGLTSVLGPGGAGKSTLLRTIAGLNDAHPGMTMWGSAELLGRAMTVEPHRWPHAVRPGIGFVTQQARFFVDTVRENLASALPNRSNYDRTGQTARVSEFLAEHDLGDLGLRLDEDVTKLSPCRQRLLAVARALVSSPEIVLADEPTTGLDDGDAELVVELLRRAARSRAVIMVTHNQRMARFAGGDILLLAGGRVQEKATAERFFAVPATPAGAQFLRTGGCAAPSPDARPEELDLAAPADFPPRVVSRGAGQGPRGFFWLWPGSLGGLPRPGIVADLDHDLSTLTGLGVTTLVTFEERPTLPADALRRHGLTSLHFPIPDMGAPLVMDALILARQIARLISGGDVVAFHCRAGLGRTGTMLACQLIFSGEPARDAIDRVRQLNPKCIQSEAQAQFLIRFGDFLSPRDGRTGLSQLVQHR